MADGLRLIMFDVDGTLLDSQAHIFEAMAAAFGTVGLVVPQRLDVRAGIGLSVEEMIMQLCPTLPHSVLVRVAQAYRKEFRAIAMRSDNGEVSGLYPAARDTLTALAAREFTLLGVATGKSRRGFDRMLMAHELEGLFTTIQVADGHPSKPHPSMLQTAMAEMGVPPEQTVMVGDTSYDMLMARTAKVRPVGVTWGYHSAKALADAGADAIATDFADLYRIVTNPV